MSNAITNGMSPVVLLKGHSIENEARPLHVARGCGLHDLLANHQRLSYACVDGSVRVPRHSHSVRASF